MAKTRHIVLARTPEILEAGVTSGKGHRRFGKRTSAIVLHDSAEAKEIEQKYKGQVAVTLDQQHTRYANNDNGTLHNYFFGGVDMSGIRSDPAKEEWEWVEYAPKRFKRVKKVRNGNNA